MKFFDPRGDIEKTAHKLPHWQQGEVAIFVTFRLADSLPRQLLDDWLRARDAFLTANLPPWDDLTEACYHGQFSDKLDEPLAAAHGSCALREYFIPPRRSQTVTTSLLITSHRRHIRHGGEDVIQIGKTTTLGALLDRVADLPGGDLGREGDGDDGVHTGAFALRDISGLTDEEVGDVGLDGHGTMTWGGLRPSRTPNLGIALTMQVLKVAEIDRVEDVRFRFSGGDQMHVVVNTAATDALFSCQPERCQ